MNYKQFYCQIPIKDNNVKIVDGIMQHDTANIIHARLMDGAEPFDFTGYTGVLIEILKPDGNHIQAMITDDPEVNENNNPYNIQVLDPVSGRVSFTLKGQATVLKGTHFAEVIVYGNGRRLTSARINYYVGDILDDDNFDVSSTGDYSSLRTILNECMKIANEEIDRNEAETIRKENEEIRANTFAENMAELKAYLEHAIEYIDQTRGYMEQAYAYAQLAQEPSAEIISGIISTLGLASTTYVDTAVSDATQDFDAGKFTDSGPTSKFLKVKTGIEELLPALANGEFGFCTDTEQLYIGAPSGNIPIGGAYVASATAPQRTDVLWIDTASGNSLKWYNGSAWKATATATFA